MKICFFNTIPTWGGGEKWHYENALALHRKGEEVVVVADSEGELRRRLEKQGVCVFPMKIGNLSFLNPWKRRRLLNFFKKGRFDVVLFNSPSDLKMAASLSKKVGIKKRIFRRGSPIPIRGTCLNRYLFGCLTDVLANSEATKRSVLELDGTLFPKERIKVIHNGIRITETGSEVQEKPNPVPVIGSLGRLEREKGHDFLIDVAALLRHRGVSFRMCIGGEGSQRETLLQNSKEKGVSANVEMVGFVQDATAFLRGIDVFVMPSRWEGFGNVLIEAMMCKKPLVGWNHSGIPELIVNGENGFLVEYGDVQAFSEAIEKLLKDKKLCEEMGERGCKMVKEKFDMSVTVRQLEEYFES